MVSLILRCRHYRFARSLNGANDERHYMRALELSPPWGTENLILVERADPAPGRGEVVVKMRAISLNFRDTVIIAKGGYSAGAKDAAPFIPFSDGCGIVTVIGVTSIG